MFTFMAGQMRIGDLTAINTVVRRSSAIPLAIFPITFAVAGAMTARSGRSAKEMCSTDGKCRSAHISSWTGFPLKVARVMGVTKFVAARVITM